MIFPLVYTPPPSFEAVSCCICSRQRVAVTRHWMVCLVLISNYYACMTQWRVSLLLYIALYGTNKSKLPLYISTLLVQLGKRKVGNPKVAGSSPLCATIFLPTVFVWWHTSLQVKTHNLNDWSVTNQIEYTCWRQDSYLSVFVGCLYRQGPTLINWILITNTEIQVSSVSYSLTFQSSNYELNLHEISYVVGCIED